MSQFSVDSRPLENHQFRPRGESIWGFSSVLNRPVRSDSLSEVRKWANWVVLLWAEKGMSQFSVDSRPLENHQFRPRGESIWGFSSVLNRSVRSAPTGPLLITATHQCPAHPLPAPCWTPPPTNLQAPRTPLQVPAGHRRPVASGAHLERAPQAEPALLQGSPHLLSVVASINYPLIREGCGIEFCCRGVNREVAGCRGGCVS
jgi:hypothetical protein